MAEPISGVSGGLGTGDVGSISPKSRLKFSGNPFEDVLSKAIDALNTVSNTEVYANQMIDKYTRGEAEMADVLIASSKASIMVQLAVTTINTAVTTFKEVTQMQI